MREKNMNIKKVIVPAVAITLLTSQLAGCASVNSGDMLDMLNNGESIVIEVAQPEYDINVVGKFDSQSLWIQLDALRTNSDLRLDFDSLFHINKITVKDINSKSGCLYVDEDGTQNGNATLQDAFRNRVFIEKYWNNPSVKSSLIKLASKAYTDVDTTSKSNVYASLNAYYDLLTDNIDPASFNSSQSVTREQFYAFVFKSSNGVQELNNDQSYLEATGGKTEYSLFAQQIDEKAFLSVEEDCLDANNARGSISRAEAVYLVVNNFFGDEINSVDGKAKSFSDCKNAGDLALKAKFKEKKDGVVTGKENWQTFTLAYMMQNPDKGMQEEIYKAMVVAHDLGLLGDGVTESRWDEPISKVEAMELLVNTFMAQNKKDGYLSKVEYGKYDETKFEVEKAGAIDTEGQYFDANTMLPSGILMKDAVYMYNQMEKDLKAYGFTAEEGQKEKEDLAQVLGVSLTVLQDMAETMKADEQTDIKVRQESNQNQQQQTPTVKPPKTNTGSNSGGGKTTNNGGNTSSGGSGSYVPVDKDGDGFDDEWGTLMPGNGLTTTTTGEDYGLHGN